MRAAVSESGQDGSQRRVRALAPDAPAVRLPEGATLSDADYAGGAGGAGVPGPRIDYAAVYRFLGALVATHLVRAPPRSTPRATSLS